MNRIALVTILVGTLFACSFPSDERELLESQGFRDIALYPSKEGGVRFEAVKHGLVCTGTAEVVSDGRSHRSSSKSRCHSPPDCSNAQPAGCTEMAIVYQHAGDRIASGEAFRKACFGGDPRACKGLYWMIRDGHSQMAPDAVLGQACELGEQEACDVLQGLRG